MYKVIINLSTNAVFLSFCSVLVIQSCTLNKESTPEKQNTNLEIKKQKIESAEDIQFKQLTNVVRFSASVEREIFKTIRSNLSPAMTQFEVISTVLDQNSGIKKIFGSVDCKLYRIHRQLGQIDFFKQCQKPEILIATLNLKKNQASIHFYTKEWAHSVGTSVAFTAKDRICEIQFSESKLNRLSCENTELMLDQSSDIEELRLPEFVFDQNATDQVHVVGGFFKNLTEHRKLKLNIPFDGKIKIIEKELKVRDDFTEQHVAVPKTVPEPEKTQIQDILKPEENNGEKNNDQNIEKNNDQKNENVEKNNNENPETSKENQNPQNGR